MVATGKAWSNENSAALELFIQPRLCVLPDGQELCEDQLEIRWRAQGLRDLCLYQRGRDKALRCWQQASAGHYEMKISTARNIVFLLKDMPSESVAISEVFEVVHDQSKFRRKRRNAWSFF